MATVFGTKSPSCGWLPTIDSCRATGIDALIDAKNHRNVPPDGEAICRAAARRRLQVKSGLHVAFDSARVRRLIWQAVDERHLLVP